MSEEERREELLEEARREMDSVQGGLLEKLAAASGPEFPWMLAASGKDDEAVRHAEQCCARSGLLREPSDKIGAALGAAWLVSARSRPGPDEGASTYLQREC